MILQQWTKIDHSPKVARCFSRFVLSRHLMAQQSAVSLKSGSNSASEMSISTSTRSSSVSDCPMTSSFISSMVLRSLFLMRDLRLYIMTISPFEGTECCMSCRSSRCLRVVISPRLSSSSLSISSFRILNISLFLIAYLFRRSSALLVLHSCSSGSTCLLFSFQLDRTFFFSPALMVAEVLARKRQSRSFMRLSPSPPSDFFSRLVEAAEHESSYSSWSCWENARC